VRERGGEGQEVGLGGTWGMWGTVCRPGIGAPPVPPLLLALRATLSSL